LQPHAPLTQAVFVLCEEQFVQTPPPVPHAEADSPLVQVPDEQHPPWHG
jgi:hypothetical protein